MKEYDSDQVLAMLKDRVEGGTQKDFAAQCGVSAPYLHDMLKGRREIGDKVLEAIGIERLTVYRKKVTA